MRAQVRKLWSTLVHEHTTPARLALAVWLGVIIGCSPFFGLHLVITIVLGFLFGLNKLVIYAAAQVSIPPLAPFLGYASVQVGHKLTTGEWRGMNVESHGVMEMVKLFFQEWLIGGAVIGTVVGGVAALVVFAALHLRASPALARAALRYKNAPPKYAYYARLKYRMDPVYTRIAAHVAENTLTVDLGAGLGMLGVFLQELGGGRLSHGIEWDEAKVAAGQAAGATIERGDITQLEKLPQADAVTLVDVLHYFDEAHIKHVLDLAVNALKPGGRLFVREGDLDAGAGAGWTRLVEKAAVRLGWNKAPAVKFLSKEKLTSLMQERGLRVHVEHASGPAHPGNLLFSGTK